MPELWTCALQGAVLSAVLMGRLPNALGETKVNESTNPLIAPHTAQQGERADDSLEAPSEVSMYTRTIDILPTDHSLPAAHTAPMDQRTVANEIRPALSQVDAVEPPPAWHQRSAELELPGSGPSTHDPSVVSTAYSAETVDPPKVDQPQPLPGRFALANPRTIPAERPIVPTDRRRLAPATAASAPHSVGSHGHESRQIGPAQRIFPGLPAGSVITSVAAMSTVLGLLLLSIWLVRRGLPKSATILPDEVVSVLGRKQIGTRQTVQLIRVGRKLLLVSVTPEGTEPLTEITDEVEVNRLQGLCQKTTPYSTSAEFQQVLDELARPPLGAGFLERGFTPASPAPAIAAYSGQIRGAERA